MCPSTSGAWCNDFRGSEGFQVESGGFLVRIGRTMVRTNEREGRVGAGTECRGGRRVLSVACPRV
jgi:hypothetical protein